jgi:hypothetical protein
LQATTCPFDVRFGASQDLESQALAFIDESEGDVLGGDKVVV